MGLNKLFEYTKEPVMQAQKGRVLADFQKSKQ
jgi:hypothetical protein